MAHCFPERWYSDAWFASFANDCLTEFGECIVPIHTLELIEAGGNSMGLSRVGPTRAAHVCIAYVARDLNQPTMSCGVTSRRAMPMAFVTASVVRAAADFSPPFTSENISSIGE